MPRRVAYVSHSLIAERQWRFAAELRRQLVSHDMTLEEVYPPKWGRHEREGGRAIVSGEMVDFIWHPSLFQDWHKDPPSAVLLQQEAYCASAQQIADYCDYLKIPFITFSWENARRPSFNAQQVFASAAFNVFGNTEAMKLAHETGASIASVPSERLPQVGIDPSVCVPFPVEKTHDIFFAGRASDPMKGLGVLEKARALSHVKWSVDTLVNENRYLSASEMALRYSQARLTCTPSRDVPGLPNEQFAPAVNLESLFCGTPVVTTKLPAIYEWLHDAPGVFFAEPDDPESLMHSIGSMLAVQRHEPEKWAMTMRAAREWVVSRFSNEVVASKYVEILGRVV